MSHDPRCIVVEAHSDEDCSPRPGVVNILAERVDIALLRGQRDWLLSQPAGPEVDGLTELLDHMLDRAEGYA